MYREQTMRAYVRTSVAAQWRVLLAHSMEAGPPPVLARA